MARLVQATHDGKPFTAADLKWTWDQTQGKATGKLRGNPCESRYGNLAQVITSGDRKATFAGTLTTFCPDRGRPDRHNQ